MGKKQINCLLCGGKVIYEESTQNYACSICNAHLSSEIFKSQKEKGSRLRLKKIRLLVALLGALYLLFFLYRRGFF